jgi:hypothetical protein
MDITNFVIMNQEDFMPDLQVESFKAAFKLLTKERQEMLLDDLLNEGPIVAWKKSSFGQLPKLPFWSLDETLLTAMVEMGGARYISIDIFRRMRCIVNMLCKQSVSMHEDSSNRTKLILWGRESPEGLKINNVVTNRIVYDAMKKALGHGLGKIKVQGKEKVFPISLLVYHFNKYKSDLENVGYDCSNIPFAED